MLRIEQLHVGYRAQGDSETILLPNLHTEVPTGTLVCVLGQNGSGKSSLLRTLAALQAPLQGQVWVGAQNLHRLKAASLVYYVSLVLTEKIQVKHLKAWDLVALGRYPHTNWLGVLQAEDKRQIEKAMQLTNTLHLAARSLETLSDGERQKVMIARALAQDSPLMILDEPTAHLDLPNRIVLMHLLRDLAQKTKKIIILSTHELDLALQNADKIWLLRAGEACREGSPEDLVLNGSFEATFAQENFRFDRLRGKFYLPQKSAKAIKLTGEEPVGLFWTQQALERKGFALAEEAAIEIHCRQAEGQYHWQWGAQSFDTIEALCAALLQEVPV